MGNEVVKLNLDVSKTFSRFSKSSATFAYFFTSGFVNTVKTTQSDHIKCNQPHIMITMQYFLP